MRLLRQHKVNMNKWDELTDFSMYYGNIPCVVCKADSSRTIMGDHWKCSACAHVFNQDGSDIRVKCYCEGCQEKQVAAQEAARPKIEEKSLKGIVSKIKKLAKKKLSKKPKVKKTK